MKSFSQAKHTDLPVGNPVPEAPDPMGQEMGPQDGQTLKICRAMHWATVAFALLMAILMLYAWITNA